MAIQAVERLAVDESGDLAISAHSLYEFYFVLTKPVASNGFGYTPQQAMTELINAANLFQILPETLDTYHTWRGLVGKYQISNRACFDAKIVASMVENRVPRILTFNDQDFRGFTEIVAVNPFDYLGIPRIS